MVKLKNTGPEVSAYAPDGDPAGLVVKTGGVLEVDGTVVTERRAKKLHADAVRAAEDAKRTPPPLFVLPADAVVIEQPTGELVAFSTSVWELVTDGTESTDDTEKKG